MANCSRKSVTISVVRDERGEISHTFSLFSDISVHKDAEARMQRMANYDSLTGLPNRCLLNQLVDQAPDRSEAPRHEHGALMVIDISRIGAISDTLGHDVGNELVCDIGQLFRGALREADILARVDDSKFVVALLHIEKREHAAHVAQKLLDPLEAPITIDAPRLQVGASIGITVYPEDGLDAPALFRFADVAVAKAGQTIESTFLFYREDMNQRAKEHLRLESEMRAGARRQGAGTALPAEGEPAQRPHRRRRSAAALAPSDARHGLAGRLHSGGRGNRLDPRTRHLGAGRGLPPDPRLAKTEPAHAADRRQPVGAPVRRASCRRASRRCSSATACSPTRSCWKSRKAC